MSIRIELINTGSELLLGRVLNSHLSWLGQQLTQAGYLLTRQVAVTDDGVSIQTAVREALTRADLIITTGGLGPTSDDLTRDLIAALLQRRLVTDEGAKQNLEGFFNRRNRPIPASTYVQAQVPEGALVLQNAHGTAPGLAMELAPNPFRPGTNAWLIMLPGPPRELRPMFTTQVLPLVRTKFPLPGEYVSRTLKVAGLGESYVEEKIQPHLQALVADGLEIGYCAKIGEVEVRLTAQNERAVALVEEAEKISRRLLAHTVFGEGEDTLEAVVVRQLTAQGQTLAVAESCTGGFIGHRLTNVSGASAVFMAGLITYSNEAKQQLLGVQAETLAQHGAVSEQTACEMAAGARARHNTDFALAVTGIAGPGGGTEAKPVGTVFVALATREGVRAEKYFNPFDRETFKFMVSQQALDLLRRNGGK